MSAMKIKKGDTVKVIAGKDKGKDGKVLAVNVKDNTVVVENVNMVTKHAKPSAANQNGGIVTKEAPLHISNVMLVVDGKATRVGFKMDGDKKVRVAKATGKTIDAIFDYKNLGKVDKSLFHSIEADKPFEIGDMKVNASHIWHDAADPVCYSFYSEEGAKASIATDLGDYDEYLVEKIYDSDILFVEANHDVNMLQVGLYPYYLKRRILGREGHLSNERCAELIEEVATQKTKKVYLGHLSKENNYEKLAYETVKISLHNFTLPIEVARRDTVSTVTSVS